MSKSRAIRKTLSGVVMVAFAGLVCTSLLAIFNGPTLQSHQLQSLFYDHLTFMAY